MIWLIDLKGRSAGGPIHLNRILLMSVYTGPSSLHCSVQVRLTAKGNIDLRHLHDADRCVVARLLFEQAG